MVPATPPGRPMDKKLLLSLHASPGGTFTKIPRFISCHLTLAPILTSCPSPPAPAQIMTRPGRPMAPGLPSHPQDLETQIFTFTIFAITAFFKSPMTAIPKNTPPGRPAVHKLHLLEMLPCRKSGSCRIQANIKCGFQSAVRSTMSGQPGPPTVIISTSAR